MGSCAAEFCLPEGGDSVSVVALEKEDSAMVNGSSQRFMLLFMQTEKRMLKERKENCLACDSGCWRSIGKGERVAGRYAASRKVHWGQ